MSLEEWPGLHPFIDVIYLLPEDSPGARARGDLSEDSLPAPPGMVAVKAGFRLNEWEKRASDWVEGDRTAMREFLAGRAREHYAQHIDAARKIQERLRSTDSGFEARVLAGWHTAGIHPSQDAAWETTASDKDDPVTKALKILSRPN